MYCTAVSYKRRTASIVYWKSLGFRLHALPFVLSLACTSSERSWDNDFITNEQHHESFCALHCIAKLTYKFQSRLLNFYSYRVSVQPKFALFNLKIVLKFARFELRSYKKASAINNKCCSYKIRVAIIHRSCTLGYLLIEILDLYSRTFARSIFPTRLPLHVR